MHDNPPLVLIASDQYEHQRDFRLDPDETKYVDVVSRFDGEPRIRVLHIERRAYRDINPPGRYELTLFVHGEGVSLRRVVVVDIDDDRLTFALGSAP